MRKQEYVAYDSEGHVLQLVPADPTVVILEREKTDTSAGELAEVIRTFFSDWPRSRVD